MTRPIVLFVAFSSFIGEHYKSADIYVVIRTVSVFTVSQNVSLLFLGKHTLSL